MYNVKKIIVCIIAVLLVGGTILGVEEPSPSELLFKANQTEYRNSGQNVTKNNYDNSALLDITSGPDRNNAPMYMYVAYWDGENETTGSPVYRTDTYSVYSTGVQKMYYYNPFDYNLYHGKGYRIFGKIFSRSRYTTVNVYGEVTP